MSDPQVEAQGRERAAGTTVREASRGDQRRIVGCLSRAFEDDPISRFLFPNDRTRLARLAAFYRQVIRSMRDDGAVYTDSRVSGAAIWRAPSPPAIGRARALREGFRMLLLLRRAVSRAMLLENAISEARPREPHWYLAILGTDPSQQGRGIGSALLEPVLRRCDADGVPAYLESSKEQNIAFYQRHGFRVTRELAVPGGPTLWSMRRDPPSPVLAATARLNREVGSTD